MAVFAHASESIAVTAASAAQHLRCVAWSKEHAWVACGGDDGLLKVLCLGAGSSGESDATEKSGANSVQEKEQTLQGHTGAVLAAAWNNTHKRLTSADETGLIIVWMLHNGKWHEEMINNRNKSVVTDMNWAPAGDRIAISYADGAVIVGGVDGNRLWGRELGSAVAQVEWSPDGQHLLSGTTTGELVLLDMQGSTAASVPLSCTAGCSTDALQLADVAWYDGAEGLLEPNCPVLAVALTNGRMQLMRSEQDGSPVCIDAGISIASIAWSHDAAILAVAGFMAAAHGSSTDEQHWLLQLYSCHGEHLHTLRLPSPCTGGIAWEHGSARLALGASADLQLAAVRQDHLWGYCAGSNTLVCAHREPQRSEQCVVFWSPATNERSTKFVKRLAKLAAAGEHACFVTKGERPAGGEHILVLCNAVGSPVDSRHVCVEPKHLLLTRHHAIMASDEVVYVWQHTRHEASVQALASGGTHGGGAEWEGPERLFHVDDPAGSQPRPPSEFKPPQAVATAGTDPIVCIAATADWLLVARTSGMVQRYSLPEVEKAAPMALPCHPARMAINCDASCLAVVDGTGTLSLVELAGAAAGQLLPMAPRKDVCDLCWAADSPGQLAVMEAGQLVILEDGMPEQGADAPGIGALASFAGLEVRTVRLEQVLAAPGAPHPSMVVKHEAGSLRHLRALLTGAGLEEAAAFAATSPHPRLWQLVGEHALQAQNLGLAERASVQCADYPALQLLKRVQAMNGTAQQRAEVDAHFGHVNAAHAAYLDQGRPDLALALRSRLGDWFQVEKLLAAEGSSNAAAAAANSQRIGAHYAERRKWAQAAHHFTQARASGPLVEALYRLEDYGSLARLARALPPRDPLLTVLGERLAGVGLAHEAVEAYLAAGQPQRAVDCCVRLSQWDRALELAAQHSIPSTGALLEGFARHLLAKGAPLEAVQLYRKADCHQQAAGLLEEQARGLAASSAPPLLLKKLHVLAALEADASRRAKASSRDAGQPGGLGVGARGDVPATSAAQSTTLETLAGLMTSGAASTPTASAGGSPSDGAWNSAQCYHLWMLAHRQLYGGQAEAALRTAQWLGRYGEVLPQEQVAAFQALAAYYAGYYGQASKAFTKLESLPSLSPERRAAFAELALAVFSMHPPTDPRRLAEGRGGGGSGRRQQAAGGGGAGCVAATSTAAGAAPADWLDERNQVCMASGKAIRNGSSVRCKLCKRSSLVAELAGRRTCPLCHANMQPTTSSGIKGGSSVSRTPSSARRSRTG